MHCNNATFPINDKAGGHGFHAAIFIGQRFVTNHDGVWNFVLGKMRTHRIPTFVIHGDAQNGEPLRLVFLIKLNEPGNFNFAWSAPGGPEIQQYNFAFIGAELDHFSVGIGQREIGSLLQRLSWRGFGLGHAIGRHPAGKQCLQRPVVDQFHPDIPFSVAALHARRQSGLPGQ